MEPGGWRVGICDISYSFLTKDCESRHFLQNSHRMCYHVSKKLDGEQQNGTKRSWCEAFFFKTEHTKKQHDIPVWCCNINYWQRAYTIIN